jgi:hypothetical protein
MTLNELSNALAAKGLMAEGQSIAVDSRAPAALSPWYVQFMLGVCAWFAGLFLLGFTLVAFGRFLFENHEQWVPLLVIGLCICTGAAFIYATAGEGSTFGSHFALALSCAGQMAAAAGMGGAWGPRAAIWGMLIFEIVLTAVMRNRSQRVLTSLGAVIAWALATHEFLFQDMPGISISWGAPPPDNYGLSLISVLLWLGVWTPVAYGAYWLVKNEARWMSEGREEILRPVTYGVIASLSIAPLATHPAALWMSLGFGPTRDLTDAAHGSTALWPLLAMFLVVLGMALAFAIRNRALLGLAILFGLLEISAFYYVLGTTLLLKSIVMVALGAALLLGARILEKEIAI